MKIMDEAQKMSQFPWGLEEDRNVQVKVLLPRDPTPYYIIMYSPETEVYIMYNNRQHQDRPFEFADVHKLLEFLSALHKGMSHTGLFVQTAMPPSQGAAPSTHAPAAHGTGGKHAVQQQAASPAHLSPPHNSNANLTLHGGHGKETGAHVSPAVHSLHAPAMSTAHHATMPHTQHPNNTAMKPAAAPRPHQKNKK